MLKQISLIVIAIGIATVLIAGAHNANAALRATQPQTILSAGHDQILRGAGSIILKAGEVSANVPLLQQRAMLAEAAK